MDKSPTEQLAVFIEEGGESERGAPFLEYSCQHRVGGSETEVAENEGFSFRSNLFRYMWPFGKPFIGCEHGLLFSQFFKLALVGATVPLHDYGLFIAKQINGIL